MSGRRSFLQQFITGVGAFNLPNVLKLRAEAAARTSPANDTSLIVPGSKILFHQLLVQY